MWGQMFGFTVVVGGVTVLQFAGWLKKGLRRDAWVFLGWMIIAWITGLLFLAGVRLPQPTQPIFPAWR